MFYPNLQAEIGRAGKTNAEVGKLAGLNPSEMSRLMHGKKVVTLDLAGKLKKAVGTELPLETLFIIKE